MYHSRLFPLLVSLTLSVCAHPQFSSQRRSLLLTQGGNSLKKLPTCLKTRLKVVCLWLHSSRLPNTALPRPRFVIFTKKNKAFFPQKKVPEPISHLALSQLLGLTMTWLTSKAHLCIYPRVLCTQNQRMDHLFFELTVLSFRTRWFPSTYF